MPAHLHPAGSLDALWALLDAWSDHMAGRELCEATINQRVSYYLLFLRRSRSSPETVTAQTCQRFLRGVTPRSSQREAYVYAIKGLYRFAIPRGYLDMADPSLDLVARGPKYDDPDSFSQPEVRAILNAAQHQLPEKRYWTILLLFETGARISSLAAVRPCDTGSRIGDRMRFLVAKNGRKYSAFLTPAAATAVRHLLELHEGHAPTLIERDKNTIGEWFRDSARAAGMAEGRVNAHLARHTFAQTLYDRTGDIALVADRMNHSSPKMTLRYARVTDERRRNATARSFTG